MQVGVVGTGIMGWPMAANLLRAGYELQVYNRTRDKCRGLEDLGARVADSPEELTRECEVVITMLTGAQALEDVVFGQGGVAGGLDADTVLVNMSSVPPSYTRELARRLEHTGCRFLDAPVSGSKKPAEEGNLVVLAGGDSDLVENVRPIFEALGRKVVHCGPVGQGSMMKMAINLLLGIMTEGLAEMINLGRQGGLDTETLLDVVHSGPMSCGLFNLKGSMFSQGEYPAQFPLKHMGKDLKFILDTAYEQGAGIPAGNAVFQAYNAAWNQGHGDQDLAAIMQYLQKQSSGGR